MTDRRRDEDQGSALAESAAQEALRPGTATHDFDQFMQMLESSIDLLMQAKHLGWKLRMHHTTETIVIEMTQPAALSSPAEGAVKVPGIAPNPSDTTP